MHQKNLNLKWFQWWVEGFQKKEMFNVPLILLKIKGSTLFLPLYLTPYALKLIGQSWAHKDQLDFASPPTLPTDLTYFKLESKNRISDALLRTRHLAEAHALKAESCIPLITSDPVYQDRLRDLTVMVTRRDKWTNSKKPKISPEMDESLFIEACFSSSSFFQISEILAFLDYQIDCTNFYKFGITTAIYRSSSTDLG